MFDGELRYRVWVFRQVSHLIDDEKAGTLQREGAQCGLKVISIAYGEGQDRHPSSSSCHLETLLPDRGVPDTWVVEVSDKAEAGTYELDDLDGSGYQFGWSVRNAGHVAIGLTADQAGGGRIRHGQ